MNNDEINPPGLKNFDIQMAIDEETKKEMVRVEKRINKGVNISNAGRVGQLIKVFGIHRKTANQNEMENNTIATTSAKYAKRNIYLSDTHTTRSIHSPKPK